MSDTDETDVFDLAKDFPEHELFERFGETNKELRHAFTIKRFRFALSQRQRDDLLRVASSHSLKHGIIIETQLRTGMRIGELQHLRIQDLNLGERTIIITRHEQDEYCNAWHPKTAAGLRIIPIDDDLVSRLKGYMRDEKRLRGYVFTSLKNPMYARGTLINYINKYAKESRTIGHTIGSHALRRTYASFLINQNVAIGIISRVLGHSSIDITMKYLFHIENPQNHDEIRAATSKMLKGDD